MNYKADRAFI